MYWKWIVPRDRKRKVVGYYDKANALRVKDFFKGEVIDTLNKSINIIYYCNPKILGDILPNEFGLVIVSKKLLNILLKICKNDIQPIKANIFIKDIIVAEYYALNLLHLEDLIIDDEELLKNGTFFKSDNLFGHELIYDRVYKDNIIMSEKLKDCIENEQLNGFEVEALRTITIITGNYGGMITYIYPDNGEEGGATISYPIEIDPKYYKKVSVIFHWNDNIHPSKQLFLFKKYFKEFVKLSDSDLIDLVRCRQRIEFGELYISPAEELAKKAKELGFEIELRDI